MNIKKNIPFTGQDKPKSNPDKILSDIYFLCKLKLTYVLIIIVVKNDHTHIKYEI